MSRAHIDLWKNLPLQAVRHIATGISIFIPQPIYKPHTQADQDRYIKHASLFEPIIFMVENPYEWGISLDDALRQRTKHLLGKDELMFENCGPSVSIRIQWPCYAPWSRQIPTKDFKNPKGPITKAKLAKNIAKCVSRFIEDNHTKRMEDDSDKRFRVGANYIKLEDLMLVSLHHISQGSWQPHFRLRRSIF
ncbi:hypothetical protein SERLA73DRAFT_58553 [Serpula lacrymans var. lacrymans S7.3]|uniref:Uncharacterized protein n=2 Tax=Serpula lacrymans var. lacrymans TaxID=341189 RepID=F8Q4U7_SERL3|nr:hypothetical protein SERLA73DRAFT_58553 [Serpula lacrymans var. lacrymans S7.3]